VIRSGRAIGIAIVLLGATACRNEAPERPALPGSQVGQETIRLVAALVEAGFVFRPAGYEPAPAPFLHAPVTALMHEDESLAIWEYATPEAAADDRQRISVRGVDGSFLELGSEARWFLRGRVLVLYIGANPTLRAVLVRVLGPTVVGPAA
jgi:hypothetical protein